MKTKRSLLISFMLLAIFANVLLAQDQTMKKEDGIRFVVNDPKLRDNVTFKSYAPLEDIVGYTGAISGYLVFDPQNPQKGGHGKLTVPVASLNTGIPMRNEHLQSAGWLDAEKFPDITLVIKSIKNVKELQSSTESASYDLTVIGDFTLHGMTNTIEFPGRITYLKESEATRQKMPGDLLAARASFTVSLKDYGVTSEIIGSKVGETIEVEVSVMGSTMAELAESQNSGM